jgi:hypothetical protein
MASSEIPAEPSKLTNVEILGTGLPQAQPLRFERFGSGERPPVAQGGPVAEKVSQFDKLVRGENDVVGLLAFAIFERHRLEWLDVFEKSCGRLPNNDELNAYVLGEATERRLVNYRELAESALAQQRQDTSSESEASARGLGALPGGLAEPRSAFQRGKWIGGGLAYLVFLAAVAGSCAWFLVHFGVVRM